MGILTSNIPEGYIVGLSRRRVPRAKLSHLYKGTFADPGQPMCKRGYEKAGDYSIWRGNVGENGICKVCLRRARAGMPPAPWPEDPCPTSHAVNTPAMERDGRGR